MGQLSLLIVDDEELLLLGLEKFFVRKDFEVYKASSVLGAKDIILTHKIDVLITDMRLPDGSGAQIIHIFKEAHPQGKIFCVTGYSEEDEKEILSLGVTKIVAKPFEKKELLALILESA